MSSPEHKNIGFVSIVVLMFSSSLAALETPDKTLYRRAWAGGCRLPCKTIMYPQKVKPNYAPLSQAEIVWSRVLELNQHKQVYGTCACIQS